jgi:hypothetical protein
MKKEYYRLTLTVLLGAFAFSTPARADWKKKFNGFLAENVSRETRLTLQKLLPGLLPINYVCTSVTPDGKKLSHFPGDVLETAAAELSLDCLPAFQGTIQKNSKASLLDGSLEPELRLESGALRLDFGKKKVSLFSSTNQFRFEGQADQNKISFFREPDSLTVACTKGLVELWIEPKKNDPLPSGTVVSDSCRLKIRFEQPGMDSYIFHNEASKILDLGLDKSTRGWPLEEILKFNRKLGIERLNAEHTINLGTKAVQGKSDNFFLSFDRPFREKLSCTLFTQKDTFSPLQKAYEFPFQEGQTGLFLPKAYQKFWLSLVCSAPSGLYISDALSPQKSDSSGGK